MTTRDTGGPACKRIKTQNGILFVCSSTARSLKRAVREQQRPKGLLAEKRKREWGG